MFGSDLWYEIHVIFSMTPLPGELPPPMRTSYLEAPLPGQNGQIYKGINIPNLPDRKQHFPFYLWATASLCRLNSFTASFNPVYVENQCSVASDDLLMWFILPPGLTAAYTTERTASQNQETSRSAAT